MRTCGRRGATGKIQRVYGLVDAYWDDIEGDLAEQFHVDALDFVRGKRPWAQFLRFVDRLSLIEGTQCWAKKFSDPEMLDQLWEQFRKDRKMFDRIDEVRPPLYGYDRHMAMLTNISNLLIALRMDNHPEISKALHMLPTPVFPREAVENRWREMGRKKRAEGIEAAQNRWQEIVDTTGVRPIG